MMSKSLLIKNIHCIVTCDSEDRVLKNTNIFIKNGKILDISQTDYPADEIINGKDMIVYPGLINTHHHLYQIFTRNLPNVQNLELFDWLKVLYGIWKGLTPKVIEYSSYVGIGELMKNGCTTCFDHHYVFPEGITDELIDIQFDSAGKLGVRFHASRGSMSLSEKDGGLPPDSVVQNIDKILMDSERLIKKYHDNSELSTRQIVLAPCSPFSVTDELMIESAKLARRYGVRLHTHLAETIDEEDFTLKKFGKRPLEYMDSLGWIGDDVWFAHGIHFNDEELELLSKTKTGIAHCPISNMKLSSGIARIPEMLKKNIPVGLAVDGSASNDGSNLLEEIRVGYLLHRLYSSKNSPSGYDMLKLATKGSAEVLGRKDLGELSIGKAGDLFMINKNRLELVGTTYSPESLVGTVGIKGGVDYTIIGGKTVVKDGKLLNIDEEKISREGNKIVEDLINLI